MSTLAATIDPASADNTFKRLILDEFKEKIAQMFQDEILDPVDFSLACCYYGFGSTYKHIGNEYKLSIPIVKRRIDAAIGTLRLHLNAEDFMYD